MNKYLRDLLRVLAVALAFFYLFPWLTWLLPNGAGVMVTAILLIAVNPLFCFIISFIYAFSNGLKWYLPLALGVFFVPSAFIFMNESALVYPLVYIVASFLGELGGGLIHGKTSKF